jgi:hypothetical protein
MIRFSCESEAVLSMGRRKSRGPLSDRYTSLSRSLPPAIPMVDVKLANTSQMQDLLLSTMAKTPILAMKERHL